ncbi:uncharacterized protein AC631_01992 [Debaryomyces fabryi]|uniref:candidapepsin n=1 Tax=Debaryomyces fabryi TaxID=58627 RepID=A0A0V1Q1A4_9ASCO|nr:uncharacterized protein AC631_01992 [Debaryomyces fabryi]KSA02256.1 hypothetical protein AC631_01992 [Debaryomyces fabryi]CUM46881.1 unnamed protein product [Debaryomyces fabryi]
MNFIILISILAFFKIAFSHPTRSLETYSVGEQDLFSPITERDSESNNGGTISLSLNKVQTGVYVTTITVGTPPQSVLVTFDTGTSDTWVRLFNSTDCRNSDEPCYITEKIFFDSPKSTSFKSLDSGFSMIYGAGEINGTWAKDNFQIGGIDIKSFQFGAGDESRDLPMIYGLVGLGLKNFESTYTFEYGIKFKVKNTYYNTGKRYVYDNFPARLKKDGSIKKNCYSVYYPNSGNSNSGIIFGGVDTAKYDSLITVPIIQKAVGDWSDYNEASMLAVDLGQVYVTYGNYKQPILGKNYPTLIDTLTYLTVAPAAVVENLATLLGGKYYADIYGIVYNCNNDIKLGFEFSGSTVFAPAVKLSDKSGISCIFPITTNEDDYMILGGKFLTQFYTFFDIDDLQISIGNYKESNKKTVQAIDVNEKAPNTKKVKNYSSTFNYSKSDKISVNYTSAIYKKGGHGSASFFNNLWNSSMYALSQAWAYLRNWFNNKFS